MGCCLTNPQNHVEDELSSAGSSDRRRVKLRPRQQGNQASSRFFFCLSPTSYKIGAAALVIVPNQ